MVKDYKQSPAGEYPWIRKVQQYLAKGQIALALRMLDRVVEYDMPLFKDDKDSFKKEGVSFVF